MQEVLSILSIDSPIISPSSWHGSCLGSESALHQISPYIGKMKSTMAKTLILKFSRQGDTILDPFVGSGTVALEGLIAGRGVVCCDTNPYAVLLTKAKLSPSYNLARALTLAEYCLEMSTDEIGRVNLEDVPKWVKAFFHPVTLREVIALARVLKRFEHHLLLACLLGILHHQRPGFLSYPASHAVPYLRTKKFPKAIYPELYQYRSVRPRLLKKIRRAYRRFPEMDHSLRRECYFRDAIKLELPEESIDAVVTSPPYMNALDYVRDNRLRLWLLGCTDETVLTKGEPMNLDKFARLMYGCLAMIRKVLRPEKKCVFVAGEISRSRSTINTARVILNVAERIGNFKCEQVIEDAVPENRRIRRKGSRVKREWIIVLKKEV